jgi:ubiquinone biosynthesis protein
MGILRKGRQLGLAVKNATRFKEIVGVFARHGFVDFLIRMNLERFMTSRWQTLLEEEAVRSTEERLKSAFEQLGPSFIKLGQLLATRPDLIPDSFIQEFSKLQDDVRTVPFELIKSSVEAELKKPLTEAFRSFEESPMAAASIAQVHAAVLHSGEQVVVKVQRPGIEKIVEQDIQLMESLATLMEKYIPETRLLGPSVIVEEFFRTLRQEIDFYIEANNLQRIAQNLVGFPDIAIPKVHRNLSTGKVLVMERFFGTSMKDIDKVREKNFDLKKLNLAGARAFFKCVMTDGLFHGDLHGGNIFVLDDGRLGIIDFGMVGRLSQKSRQQLSNMVLALVTEDFEALCIQYAEFGAVGPQIDFDAFQREIRNSLSPYMGLKANEVNTGRVLIEATRIATRYQIRVPGDWMMVFRALFTMEGMGRNLDPEFDMLEIGKELMQDIVQDQFALDKYSKDLIWIGKDLLSLAQVLPRQMRWALKKWNQDGFAFEIKSPELANLTEQLDRNQKRQSTSIVVAGLMISAAIALGYPDQAKIFNFPILSVGAFLAGLILWVRKG